MNGGKKLFLIDGRFTVLRVTLDRWDIMKTNLHNEFINVEGKCYKSRTIARDKCESDFVPGNKYA